MESDPLIKAYDKLVSGAGKVHETEKYKLFDDEEILPVTGMPELHAVAKAAENVHNDTTVATQRKIDAWFDAEDFGALVVGNLVNEPYNKTKHLSMLVEHGKLVKVWREAQLAEAMAKGPVSMLALKIREYEETHSEAIAALKAEENKLIDGALGIES